MIGLEPTSHLRHESMGVVVLSTELFQELSKKLKFVERILNKCIFHDLKINHVFITFYIFSLLFDINSD